MAHLKCSSLKSEIEIFKKRSKNTWNFKTKFFLIEKFSRMEFLKYVQTHVKDFRRMLAVLYKRWRRYSICITTQNGHVSKTVQFQCLKATSEHLQIEKIDFLEISRVEFVFTRPLFSNSIGLPENVARMLRSQNLKNHRLAGVRSLCEKISQRCGEFRSYYCGVCFYVIVLPTGKITAL